MRKIISLLSVLMLALFASCTSDDYVGPNIIVTPETDTQVKLPSTEVFVQGTLINSNYTTRAGKYGDKWPKSMAAEEGWESAKFSIRIDGTIPGYVNQDKALYWGGQEGPNLGKIDVTYPFGTYNDRDLDYYLVDKKTGNNIGLFRYVLDPTGVNVVRALKEIPDVWKILEYWQKQPNVQSKDKLDAILANRENLKVIWYVAKEVGGQYYWHVNGIIVDKSIDDVIEEIKEEIEENDLKITDLDPSKTPENVEVDIHLQEHKDWNEIKTSIHIRQDAEEVTVNIPINYDNIVEADDFYIRIYDYYFSGWQLKNFVTHDVNGITINVRNIDPDIIADLKQRFGDGLTIEVHSYTKQLDGVWEEVKKSTVVTKKPCTIIGQITTVYDADDKVKFGE